MSIAELAREPSPEHWRLLCQALDKLSVQDTDAAITSIEPLLDSWPDKLRATMCGMTWDDEFFAGRPNPRSTIVRYLRFDRLFTGRYDHSIRMRPQLQAAQVGVMSRSDGMKHLTWINLGNQLDATGISMLAQGTHFEQLRTLKLSSSNAGDGACLAQLAGSEFYGRLEELDLSNSEITDATVARLFPTKAGPRELRLSGNRLGAKGAAMIAKRVKRWLHRLDLGSCNLGDLGCAELSQIAQPLDSLVLDSNGVTDRGLFSLVAGPLEVSELSLAHGEITQLGNLLDAEWPLAKLHFGDNVLDDATALLLAKRAPNTLTSLTLSDNDITAVGLAALLGSPRLEQLEQLDLATNRIGAFPSGGAKLGKLEHLSLAYNRLGDGIRALAAIDSDALTHLDLSNNLVDVRALEELTGASWFSRLTMLNLSHNPLGPGAGVVFGAWPIETLSLSNTGLGDRGAMTLFDAGLQPKSLDLDGCELTDDTLLHLASSPTLAKLEYLSLDNNAITERGVRALHAAMPARLKQLRIGDNRIDDEAAFELAKWDELLYLDVDGNPIGKRAEAAIAKRPVRCCP